MRFMPCWLSNATGAALTRSKGIGTILDDDPLPEVKVNDVAVLEGYSDITNATFTATLSYAVDRHVTVEYADGLWHS